MQQVFPNSLKVVSIERSGDTTIVVRSERTFKIIKIADAQIEVTHDHKAHSSDNILSVAQLPDGFMMLCSHNYVEHWNGGSLTKRVLCSEENCILYSGDIRGDLIAAGTVFRSLLVWDAHSGKIIRRL